MEFVRKEDVLNCIVGDSTSEKKARELAELILEHIPAVDAVEVVRCKDCKHCDPEDKKCDCGHAILWQLPRDDDWFCADGERRDDELQEDNGRCEVSCSE